jgi:nucleoid-associated protein YgaU
LSGAKRNRNLNLTGVFELIPGIDGRKLDVPSRWEDGAMPDDEPDFSDVQGGSSSISSDTQVDRTYTVRRGDSLSKIAKALLGDAKKWRLIYDVNKDVVGSNPDLIKPGQVLKIPKA